MRIVWQPQPKQTQFLQRPEYEALYGGAAGGGKSDSLIAEALRQVEIPHYRALILRKTFPELRTLIDRSDSIYGRSYPKARYNSTDHIWKFPSGAQIIFGQMQHSKDKKKYQGQAYDFIGVDELTHFTFEEYSYLFSRNRPTGPGTRVYMRATANPGGVGHGWVKERFITPAPPLTPIKDEYTITKPDGTTIVQSRKRIFVPATVFDNKILLDNDPNYLASLAMLPQKERDALLYGNWNSFEGQVFTEWKDDPDHYDDQRNTHVINPFPIPSWWPIWRGFDFGYSKPFSVGWYAVDPERRMYRIYEYYGCEGTPNTGVKMDPVEIARNIRRIETEHPLLKGKEIRSVADPAIFDRSRGESIADMMEHAPNFVTWGKGDNTRLAGKMQFHYRLAFDADGRPMFYCFNTCTNFIRTIPALVYDQKDVEDIDTNQEDHIYDECRYVFMENPIAARKNELAPPPVYDPLDLYKDRQRTQRDGFYRI